MTGRKGTVSGPHVPVPTFSNPPPPEFIASTKAESGIVHLDLLSLQTNTTSAPARESILIHNVGKKYLITPYHKNHRVSEQGIN